MPASSQARLIVGTQEVTEIASFSYQSDCLAVGEECEVTVINHRGKYAGSLGLGERAYLEMRHPDVQGGAWVRRHSGRIVRRRQATGAIHLSLSDLGWHLKNSCAPLWYKLKKGTLEALCNPSRAGSLPDERRTNFGLKGYRQDNAVNRSFRMNRQEQQADEPKIIPPVHSIQVEPGDTYLDKLVERARLSNGLINVSVDDQLQVWNPNYKRAPAYELRRTSSGPNNILPESELFEDLSTRWTEVECVGEQLAWEKINNPSNPNATKKRGHVTQKDVPADQKNPWPFVHRLTFSDGQMWSEGLAQKAAEWRYKRGLFDSFYVEYVVADHFQRSRLAPAGLWYEADAMISVEDEEFDLSGVFWLQAVRAEVSERGDICRLLVRRPGLLTASFGAYPTPPRQRKADTAAAKAGQ